MTFVLDREGIAEILKSQEVTDALLALGHAVAAEIDATDSHGQKVPVLVGAITTDRAHIGVTLAHPAGLPIEAKHGTLVRAASAVGLEVTAKK